MSKNINIKFDGCGCLIAILIILIIMLLGGIKIVIHTDSDSENVKKQAIFLNGGSFVSDRNYEIRNK